MSKPFAIHEGEDPEQTADYIASLEVSLKGCRDRGEADSAKQVEAELERMRGGKAKQTRPRAAAAETREKGDA